MLFYHGTPAAAVAAAGYSNRNSQCSLVAASLAGTGMPHPAGGRPVDGHWQDAPSSMGGTGTVYTHSGFQGRAAGCVYTQPAARTGADGCVYTQPAAPPDSAAGCVYTQPAARIK